MNGGQVALRFEDCTVCICSRLKRRDEAIMLNAYEMSRLDSEEPIESPYNRIPESREEEKSKEKTRTAIK